jgi:galactose-1-phosphate uridylyltransferase
MSTLYTVVYELYGKEFKVKVRAENVGEAIRAVRADIKIHKVIQHGD